MWRVSWAHPEYGQVLATCSFDHSAIVWEEVVEAGRKSGALSTARHAADVGAEVLAVLGPEPLGNDFHEQHLIDAFRGKNTPVKSALLDQGIVAGLGNIYVCEALYRGRVSPRRKAGQISAPRVAATMRPVSGRPSMRSKTSRAPSVGS